MAALTAWSPDQHRDPVPRDGGERLERRYRCACPRRVGTGALDVERGREARPLPRGHEAQRLILRGRDRAYRLELFEGTHQREVARGDVAENEQAHSACNVLCGHRVRGGRSGTRAQPSAQVDLPRDAERRRSCLGMSGTSRLHGVVVAGAADQRAPVAPMLGNSEERLMVSPPRAARTRSTAILMSRFSRAARPMSSVEHGIAEAFPPGDVRLGLGAGAAANWLGTSTVDCSTGVAQPARMSASDIESVFRRGDTLLNFGLVASCRVMFDLTVR